MSDTVNNQPGNQIHDRTIFDDIVDGKIPSYKVWEDDSYLAFLTPFPNTPGVTVIIPKQNPGDYIFDMTDEAIAGLMVAVKHVSKLLEAAFDVPRVGVVFEGTGVAHVHAKLYPLHGELAGQTDIHSLPSHQEFYPQYAGHISTVEGPRMADEALQAIHQKILKAAEV